MPQYMVTMNLLKVDPLLSMGQLTNIVREAILPSLDVLEGMQSKGKILAGGHPAGQRYIVLFMEAESEEELRELLGELPLSELGNTAVSELKSFEELQPPPLEGTLRPAQRPLPQEGHLPVRGNALHPRELPEAPADQEADEHAGLPERAASASRAKRGPCWGGRRTSGCQGPSPYVSDRRESTYQKRHPMRPATTRSTTPCGASQARSPWPPSASRAGRASTPTRWRRPRPGATGSGTCWRVPPRRARGENAGSRRPWHNVGPRATGAPCSPSRGGIRAV